MYTQCFNCLSEIFFPEGKDQVRCPACTRINDRPRSRGETMSRMKRANELCADGEFRAAEALYHRVLEENLDEHEARWGLLLCKYGVIYERDNGGRRYPTCRVDRTSAFCSEPEFRRACELASPEVRAQYEADGRYIDAVQSEIRRLEEEEPPYDVFICYKETASDGNRTVDSVRAYELYAELTRMGYHVFYAPESLANRLGADYEAAIYHAIYTAQVMLVVGACPEHFESTWVRSEWRRFLEQIDSGARKRLVALYQGMRAEQLPADFINRRLQGVDMDRLGALQDVESFLRKFIRRPEQAQSGPKRSEGPVDALKRRAESGDADAQMALGRRFELGDGVEKDAAQAGYWYVQALVQGRIEAMAAISRLGGMPAAQQSAAGQTVEPQRSVAQAAEPQQTAAGQTVEPKRSVAQAAESQQSAVRTSELRQSAVRIVEPQQTAARTAEPQQSAARTDEPQQSVAQAAEPQRSVTQTAEPQTAAQTSEPQQAVEPQQPTSAAETSASAQAESDSVAEVLARGRRLLEGAGDGESPEQTVAALGACRSADEDRRPEAREIELNAANPEIRAMYLRARALWNTGTEAEVRAAVGEIGTLAQRGDRDGQYWLACCCRIGMGVEKDEARAATLYRLSADQGCADAQYALGECHESGQGVEKDDGLAMQWYGRAAERYRAAADAGDTQARTSLARCHDLGRGVEKDEAEATALYRLSAIQGDAEAQYQLGMRLRDVSGKKEEAAEWFRRAADQNHPGAETQMALALLISGPNYDRAEKYRWERRAFEHGGDGAATILALAHKYGVGVEENPAEAFRLYMMDAKRGRASACLEVGECYEKGFGTQADFAEAARWYRRAADGGDGRAMINLGRMYETGKGVKKDPAQALKLYEQAAQKEEQAAAMELGRCHEQGVGTVKDLRKALEWYRRVKGREEKIEELEARLKQGAAPEPSARAAYLRARCLRNTGTAAEVCAAAEPLQALADRGVAEGMYWLGRCRMEGVGMERDERAAVMLYLNAAELGNADAQYALGEYHRGSAGDNVSGVYFAKALSAYGALADQGDPEGWYGQAQCWKNGVNRDAGRAVMLYRQAAEKGHAAAAYQLGECYAHGLGVNEDAEQAAQWYETAAALGQPDAERLMGEMYETGANGLEQSDSRSFYWRRRAVEHGDEAAVTALAGMYWQGRGTEPNVNEACRLTLLAAKRGDAKAQFAVGVCCEQGVGMAIWEPAQAEKWYALAAEQRYAPAELALAEWCKVRANGEKDGERKSELLRGSEEMYRRIAERDAKELYEVAMNCVQNNGMPGGGMQQAGKWFELAAERRYAPAELELGVLCAARAEVEADSDRKSALLRRAAAMYRRAAEKGLTEACYRLGRCCENGLGTAKDEDEALKWYEKSGAMGIAAKQALENRRRAAAQVVDRRGHRTETGTMARPITGSAAGAVQAEQAQVVDRRGHRTETGTNSGSKYAFPFSTIDMSDLEQEDPLDQIPDEDARAELWMGKAMEFGPDGDPEEAEKCYRHVASLGYAEAQYCLGGLLERRERPNGNLREAAEWYRKAADQEHQQAMYALAMLLYEGVGGVAKDRSGALRLLKKAASMGNKGAKSFLNKHLKFGRLW